MPNESQPSSISRRRLMFGGASLVGSAVIGKKLLDTLPEQTLEPETLPSEVKINADNQAREEIIAKPESNSSHFNEERDAYAERYQPELQTLTTANEVIALLQENFAVTGISDELVQSVIKNLLPGLVFVESRYQTDRISKVGAFGLMQLMPATWNELAKEDESPDDLVSQVRVAGRLFSQAYQHITNTCQLELQAVCEQHFAGDRSALAVYFVGPIVINSYNAGMGTMADMIKRFAQNFTTAEATAAALKVDQVPTGYDVFLAMTKTAAAEQWFDQYKNHARAYTVQVHGAHAALLKQVESGTL